MFPSAMASSSPVVTPAATASRSSSRVNPTSRPALRMSSICSGVLISSERSSTPISRPSALGHDVERVEDSLGDLVDRTHAVDLVDDPPSSVDPDQRLGLLAVHFLATADDLLGVVRSALEPRTLEQSRHDLVGIHGEYDGGVQLV